MERPHACSTSAAALAAVLAVVGCGREVHPEPEPWLDPNLEFTRMLLPALEPLGPPNVDGSYSNVVMPWHFRLWAKNRLHRDLGWPEALADATPQTQLVTDAQYDAMDWITKLYFLQMMAVPWGAEAVIEDLEVSDHNETEPR